MKRSGMMLVVALLVLSMVAAASARADTPGNEQEMGMDTGNMGPKMVPKDDALAAKVELRLRAMNADSEEGCVDVLAEMYESAGEERLTAMCQNMRKAETRVTVQARVAAVSEDVRARLDAAQQKKLELMGRSRMKEFEGLDAEEVQGKLGEYNIREVAREQYLRAREVAKEKKEAARERYQNAVRNYNDEKEGFEQERLSWRAAVDEGDDEAAIEHAKSYLTHAANLILETLDKVEAQAAENDDLTEEEYQAIVDDITEQRAAVEDLIDQLDAATTKDEVKEIGWEILSLWDGMKNRLRIHAENVIRANVNDILKRSALMEQRLEDLISQLEEQGFDTTSLDAQMEKFSDLIESAREKLAEANSLMIDARIDNDTDKLQEARDLIRSAHDDLRNANEALKSIWSEIRAMGWEGSLDDGDDDTVIVIDDPVSGGSKYEMEAVA